MSGLRFLVQPEDAEIRVDGDSKGLVVELNAGAGVLRLKPGIHAITLVRPGYSTWRVEVTVAQSIQTIEVAMDREP